MEDGSSNRSRLIALVVLLAALVVAVVVVTATGDDGDEGGGGDGTALTSDTDLETKPSIEIPEDSTPPAELEVTDIVEGDGAEAKTGDTLNVRYVGVNYSDGREFDSSWETGQPFPVQLGAGGVIPGWEEGLPGMKVGGRRQLVIPPDLAYGATGQPPDIGPNETLVFVIDLVDLK